MAKLIIVVNIAKFFLSHRLPIAQAALDHGYEVHVATSAGEGVETIVQRGFIHHPISMNRWGTNPFFELKLTWDLYWLYQKVKPDLVHHVTIKPVLFGSFAARLAKVPAVVNAVSGLGHVFSAEGRGAGVLKKLVQLFYKVTFFHPNKHFILQNPDDQEALLSFGHLQSHETTVIKGAGVDMERFKHEEETGSVPLVILASRLLWDKGIGEYIEAVRRLQAKKVNARFALMGTLEPGNPSFIDSEQINQWVKSGAVEWWGDRTDMPEVFARSHVVCLPSYREGVPKVLIEAASCGRPIVTTNTPGCREIVRQDQNGFLVPVQDSMELTAALEKLISDPDLRHTMGKRGRELVRSEFSVEIVIKMTLAVYRELLERVDRIQSNGHES